MASVIQKLLSSLSETEELKRDFENLKDGEFRKTSERDADYNCIAYAAGDQTRRWWPSKESSKHYWPKGAPKTVSVKSFVTAFKKLGYVPCDSAAFEEGFEKVAIFVTHVSKPFTPVGTPTHMAIQWPNGEWRSKLGGSQDIAHKTLEAIGGWQYGEVKQILKRKRKNEKNQAKK